MKRETGEKAHASCFTHHGLTAMSFEWQTEEEFNWDEEVSQLEPPAPEHRRWPWLALVAVLLVGTAVFLLYRQLNQRVEVATEDVEANLIASYAVLQQAAQNKDENLFSSLLSGREPEWSLAQQANLSSGLLFDRPGFRLEWQPGLAETAVFSQTLSPDLTAAELTTIQNYSLEIGNGLTQTVSLERVDVYRLGADRWLLAPPERDFWDVRRRLEGQLLSVRYPARDEQIVHRLAADLEAKLVQLCAVPEAACPLETQVRVLFSPEPESLIEATFIGALTRQDMGDVLNGGQAVRLPAPSLVGLPQDEVGYQALFRGYASQLLLLAINDMTGWECCNNVPFYRAAVTRQLYELGVAKWPLLDTAVATGEEAITLQPQFPLGVGGLYWNAPFPETPTDFAQTPAPYIVVAFLTDELHLPISVITASLGEQTVLFSQWLTELAGPSWTEATLNNALREYMGQWLAAPTELAEPDAGLMLLCRDQQRSEQGLYYFDYSREAPLLLEGMGGDNVMFFVGLPDGSGVAVAAQRSDTQPETYLLRGDEQIPVNWDRVVGILSRPPAAIPTTTDPNGRYLLWTILPEFATDTFYAITDLAACRDGPTCDAIPLGGYPIWSPSAERLVTLTVTNPWWSEGLTNGLMLLRDTPTAEALSSPGFGASVFWRNEEQFGYVTQFQNGQQLALADGSLEGPEVVIDNAALLSLLKDMPTSDGLSSLRIQLAQPLPANPDEYLILADEWQAGGLSVYLLLYNHAAERISLLAPLPPVDFTVGSGLRWSPDGRFLLISLANDADAEAQLALFEDTNTRRLSIMQLEGETVYPRHFYASWSPDGQWLAMPELGYIRLWHNGADERLLNFDNLDCTNAAWVARMEP